MAVAPSAQQLCFEAPLHSTLNPEELDCQSPFARWLGSRPSAALVATPHGRRSTWQEVDFGTISNASSDSGATSPQHSRADHVHPAGPFLGPPSPMEPVPQQLQQQHQVQQAGWVWMMVPSSFVGAPVISMSCPMQEQNNQINVDCADASRMQQQNAGSATSSRTTSESGDGERPMTRLSASASRRRRRQRAAAYAKLAELGATLGSGM